MDHIYRRLATVLYQKELGLCLQGIFYPVGYPRTLKSIRQLWNLEIRGIAQINKIDVPDVQLHHLVI
jgi:hypothetical protein